MCQWKPKIWYDYDPLLGQSDVQYFKRRKIKIIKKWFTPFERAPLKTLEAP